MTEDTALVARGVTVRFAGARGGPPAEVVRHVGLRVGRGRTLAVVGESGSGKSALIRALMRLPPAPGAQIGGEIWLSGTPLHALGPAALRRRRGAQIAMIFQDPGAALSPLLSVGTQMVEVLRTHLKQSRPAALATARRHLVEIGLADPDRVLQSFPHQLSGGMRQRAVIAMALSCDPQVILADEPTTALDPTVAAAVRARLSARQAERGTAMVWISHDLGAVAGSADAIAVLYAGRIVEEGPAAAVLTAPGHPYTAALLACRPRLQGPVTLPAPIPGAPPDPASPPTGCAFAPRCPRASGACEAVPALAPRVAPAGVADDASHRVACHHPLAPPTGGGPGHARRPPAAP